MKKISLKEALSSAWSTFKKHPWLLIGVTLTVMFLPMILQYIIGTLFNNQILKDMVPLQNIVRTLVSTVMSVYLSAGMTRILLKLTYGKNATFSDLFEVTGRKFLMILLTTVFFIILFMPVSLLIGDGGTTPGLLQMNNPLHLLIAAVTIMLVVIVVIKFMFSTYLIVDKDLNAFDSLKQSFHMTKGHESQLLLLLFIAIGIVIVGLLALLVGFFVAVPIVYLTQAYYYHKLRTK